MPDQYTQLPLGPAPALKHCPHCDQDKPLDDFSVVDKRTGRRLSWCKACRARRAVEQYQENPAAGAARARAWREKNPDKVRAIDIRFREAHRETINERQRERTMATRPWLRPQKRVADAAYRERHRGRLREKGAAYREQHATAIAERERRWREAHPERIRAIVGKSHGKRRDERNVYNRRWRQENPEKARAACATRRARIMAAPLNDFTVTQWREMLGYYGETCAYCGATGVPLEQEHMTPLSRGGSHTAANICPACRACNAVKSDKTLAEFLLRS